MFETKQTEGHLLRRALQANAVFSGTSGLILIFGAGTVASLLGINAPLIFMAIGISLILYAAILARMFFKVKVDRSLALVAAILDTGWVIGSVIILFDFPLSLTYLGKWLVAGIAGIVAILAGLQLYGLWKSRKEEDHAAGQLGGRDREAHPTNQGSLDL